MASSLPTDPLLEILLRLEEPTDVIRCAGVCKPWRRAIIDNAASLRPRPGRRFDPNLLLGVFHFGKYEARLWRTPGPFQSALPSNGGGGGGYETARSLIPAAPASASTNGACSFVDDRGLYRELLWSADGYILLMARTVNRLCLFNPMTGDCAFLPAAASKSSAAYFLLTGRILAVQKRDRFIFSEKEGGGLSYQVLFTSAGAGDSAGVWGPVQRSNGGGDVAEQGGLCVCMARRSTLVCGDVVYWLAGPREGSITCTLALDVRTGRTWTTELPQSLSSRRPPILATSSDGRLSFIETSLPGPWIRVWVLLNNDDGDADAWWTLQQLIAVDVSKLRWAQCPGDDELPLRLARSLSTFCPRSGCVVGACLGREFIIEIHGGSPPRARLIIGEHWGLDCHPYEMDCSSTFISKMKHF